MAALGTRRSAGLALLAIAAGLLAVGSGGVWVSENYAVPAPHPAGGPVVGVPQTYIVHGLKFGAGQWVLAAAVILAVVASLVAVLHRRTGVVALVAVPVAIAASALGSWFKANPTSGGFGVDLSFLGLVVAVSAVALTGPGKLRGIRVAPGVLAVAVVGLVVAEVVTSSQGARVFLGRLAGTVA